MAFLFGSMAQGTDKSSSDVDLFVVDNASFSEVVAATAALRERLGREVNPVVMTLKDFAAQRASRERFVTRVMNEPKLFLMGTVDDLG